MKKIYMQPECEWLKLQDDIVRTSETKYECEDSTGALDNPADEWEW